MSKANELLESMSDTDVMINTVDINLLYKQLVRIKKLNGNNDDKWDAFITHIDASPILTKYEDHINYMVDAVVENNATLENFSKHFKEKGPTSMFYDEEYQKVELDMIKNISSLIKELGRFK